MLITWINQLTWIEDLWHFTKREQIGFNKFLFRKIAFLKHNVYCGEKFEHMDEGSYVMDEIIYVTLAFDEYYTAPVWITVDRFWNWLKSLEPMSFAPVPFNIF